MLVTGTRVFPRLERIWGQATRGVLQDPKAVFNAFTRKVRTRVYLSKAGMRVPNGLSLPFLAIVNRFRKETHVLLTFAVHVNISSGWKYTRLQRTDS